MFEFWIDIVVVYIDVYELCFDVCGEEFDVGGFVV